MNGMKATGLIILLLLLIVIFASSFVVHEGQTALLLHFGKIEKAQTSLLQPGLHFKWPFVNQVRKFDMRLRTTGLTSRILTQEQKYISVDYGIKWHIQDLTRYYESTGGDVLQIEQQLQSAIDSTSYDQTIQNNLSQMLLDNQDKMISALKQSMDKTAQNLGIEIVDLQIVHIGLSQDLKQSILNNMKQSQEIAAQHHRQNGKIESEKLRLQADTQKEIILTKAQEQAAEVRAKAIADAAEIRAKAYQRDLEFYRFYQSMQNYRKVLDNKNTIFILSPKNQFFTYFAQMKG